MSAKMRAESGCPAGGSRNRREEERGVGEFGVTFEPMKSPSCHSDPETHLAVA
jgi:hypothetical protein